MRFYSVHYMFIMVIYSYRIDLFIIILVVWCTYTDGNGGHYFFKYIFLPFLFSASDVNIMHILSHVMVSHISQELHLFFLFLFFLCWLILSCTSWNLLLNPFSEFFIVFILLFNFKTFHLVLLNNFYLYWYFLFNETLSSYLPLIL